MSRLLDKEHWLSVTVTTENIVDVCDALIVKVKLGLLTSAEVVEILKQFWNDLVEVM